MTDLLKSILQWARISRSGGGSGQVPKQQLSYKDKVANAVVLFPYGICSNIPEDTLAVFGDINGQSENRVIFGCTDDSRPSLSSGEVAVYHPETGATIKMNSNGTISITGDVNFTGDVSIDGNLTVGPSAKDFLTHTHIGSPTAPVGAISPTGAVV